MAETPKKKRKKPAKPEVVQYPAAVVSLARAFKAGQDCGFALRDALLEAGQPGPAGHFMGAHPCQPGNTCLVVEEILDPPAPAEVAELWHEGEKTKPTSQRYGEAERDLTDDFLQVCHDLERRGVALVEIGYDGYGDSGTIEDITLFDRAGAEVPITKLGLLKYPHACAGAGKLSLQQRLAGLAR